MINDFIEIITGMGVTLQEFTYVCIICFVLYFPISALIKKIFGGVNNE